MKQTLFTLIFLLSPWFGLNPMVLANPGIEQEKAPGLVREHRPVSHSWAFAIDNDFLVPGDRDQDYTGGFTFTHTGSSAQRAWFSLAAPLNWVDDSLGLVSSAPHVDAHSIEVGLFGFTPEDISQSQALPDDRPYASLVYIANSRERVNLDTNTAWKSSLTLGFLGLDVAENIQSRIHKLVGSEEAQGWDNQISEDGELTARYSLAHQHYYDVSNPHVELKTVRQLSVGYITELSWSLNARLGNIHTGWWSFAPESVSYGEQSGKTGSTGSSQERYFWAGLSIKARAYNALVQGQFRSSEVSYDFDELNHVLLEAWLGYTHGLGNDYRLSYVLRGHSSEIESGQGDRDVIWGGLILSKTI